jgi:hypothetical protein
MEVVVPDLPPEVPPPEANPAPARRAPRATLANGKLERDKDGTLRFSVDYEFHPGDPVINIIEQNYVLVVRSGERILDEILVVNLVRPENGKFRGKLPAPRIPLKAPVETFLESKRLIIGKIGWQRECISNLVELAD